MFDQMTYNTHTHGHGVMCACVDVRALLGGDALLSDAKAQSIFRELNLKHFTAVETPDGAKALLTPHAELSSPSSPGAVCREYLEPESGKVLEVDHVKQACTGQRDALDSEAPSADVHALRSGVATGLNAYVKDTYPGGVGAAYASMKEDGIKEVAVCISSVKVSPRNFWCVLIARHSRPLSRHSPCAITCSRPLPLFARNAARVIVVVVMNTHTLGRGTGGARRRCALTRRRGPRK